jgi:hypothetical protein
MALRPTRVMSSTPTSKYFNLSYFQFYFVVKSMEKVLKMVNTPAKRTNLNSLS